MQLTENGTIDAFAMVVRYQLLYTHGFKDF